MSQPPWPFPHPNGGVPIAFGGNVSSASINNANDAIAAAADGRLWTDVAVLRKWSYLADVGFGASEAATWDPTTRRFLVGSDTGNAFSWSISGARWINDGLSPLSAKVLTLHANPAGVILAGGLPTGGASTLKIGESTDGGETWANRNIGASDTGEVHSIVYVQSLGLWLASKRTGTTGIFSSTDRVTWTQRSSGFGVFVVREAPTRILAINGTVGTNTGYSYSDDGINWTSQIFPFNVDTASLRGFWSDHYGKFFVPTGGGPGIYTSTTGLTGSWTSVSSFGSSSVSCFGRVILRGDGKASIDGGTTWKQVFDADFGTVNWSTHAFAGVGALALRPNGGFGQIFTSQIIGY